MRRFVLFTAVLCFAAAPTITHAADAVDFSRDIQPLLQQHCAECHGGEERNGSLSFDDRTSAFAEADSGRKAIIPGQSKESELIRRIRSTHEDEQMPPEGDRLSEAEIALVARWIDAGALWPESPSPSAAPLVKSDHWSFQPLSNAQPPEVHDPDWSSSGIDHFLQKARIENGLAPTEPANAQTLIRRASYDLTGLPPSPDEVARFVATAEKEGTEKAFADLVDDLLSRPTYGERWGRHWMDWVRYADTAGDNSDFPIPQAYLYRNYIIDSFNQDLPYNRFVTEQIAGDLLPADTLEQRNRQTIATGYLAMSRRFGSLVERYPWHLTIEDTIDNMGRTMLGLTISCARCHDHKFDPISTRDYYGIYGILASTRYPFPGIELFQTQMDLVPLLSEEDVAETMKPHQEQTDKLKSELEKILAECEQKAQDNAAKAPSASIAEQRKMSGELDRLLLKARKAGEALAKHLKSLPEMPTAYAVQDAIPANARVQIKGEPDRPGAEVPRKFPDVLGGQKLPEDIAARSSGRLQLAEWITSPENPLTARVIVNRIWQRHFGTGLVPSASDFGLRGEEPTHPELLDWLAAEFIRSGWSIKHLHRLIMNSRTYQLASSDVPQNLASDPGNQFYWKFNRQRLDAESIRDTLLLISGKLEPGMPGEPHPFPEMKKWTYTQHHPFKDSYDSNRRSVYLMTKRLTVQPYFQTFDGADPNVCTSDRDQSVTALQALYFVNDEFLHRQASEYGRQLATSKAPGHDRLRTAFETILCRTPTPQELSLLEDHLAAVRKATNKEKEAEKLAWASVTRSLFRLNEFLYID